MLNLMICLSFMISIIFMFLNHPLSLGLILLLQTILIALISGLMHLNFWYSYILFLIMIGGMLILFMYMTSIASNEKFKFSNKIFFMTLIILSMSMLIIFLDKFFINLNPQTYDSMQVSTPTIFNLSLFKFFNIPSSNIFYMIILYLLITLIMVVKITNIKSGPLRQK
uniref:NADH-ubiquinone oxidoreductase chain 6 n=1 Tax=Coleoptera sp. ACP-2013 TaxID=2485033 RepID=A0A3G3MEB1_9COLE|nr:NADH dehydrogenase subunit 6 [Coleoptera sp. ACP-2013]